MLELTPEWCNNYDEFWDSIRKRNSFFIRLRYLAFLFLILFVLFSGKNVKLILSDTQKHAIIFIALFLLVYNFIIHYSSRQTSGGEKNNPVHLSILQMIVDLILLTVIVYFTGGIESPFLPFYIFHMIIGSLLLPSFWVYLSAFSVSLAVTLLVAGEYYGCLTHYCIFGLFNAELYNHFSFVSITLITFYTTLFFSVFIANKIAKQLYVQEEHLIAALKELKTTDEKKQKYIMGVMHEIKSPIAASQSITDLILGGYLGGVPEKIMRKIERIKTRNNEAIEMINDVLRISRIHLLGENELEEINPVELLEEEKNKIIEIAKAKKITISNIPPRGNFRLLKGDAKVMKLALSNIFGNSIKYTPPGGKVETSIKFDDEFLEIKICDNGKGIPKSELEKVFVPFYRLKRDKGASEGSGLGLALVKEIINQHHGEILLKSPSEIGDKENPGTCCLLKLPYLLNNKVELPKV
jgi:signal transduction histidine kinase